MKNFTKTAVITILLSLIFSSLYFSAECKEISNNVFRLHIIANSDSDEDQSLKLKLRDYILKQSENIFKNAKTKEESINAVQEQLSYIEDLAQKFVYDCGYSYGVKAEIKNMYFNTRIYDNFAMPAGSYDALRITIGRGEGKNWWCVMYPPVCLPSACDSRELEAVLDDKQLDIVENEPKYEIKFKIVEIFEAVQDFFKK